MEKMQNIKNFLRHGKQARQNAEPTTDVSNVHAQSQHHRYNQAPDPVHHGISEPLLAAKPQGQPAVHGDYSVGAGAGDNRNIAAQAGGAAAQATADKQKQAAAAKERGVDPSVLERIVAEEREARGKLPNYPGLERWTLLEKMGDGAFSNVYRARDTTGQWGEVAIKVVRKFEMNSQQVSIPQLLALTCPFPCLATPPSPLTSQSSVVFWTLPTRGRCRATSMCIRTSRRQKQPRCATLPILPDACPTIPVASTSIPNHHVRFCTASTDVIPAESEHPQRSTDHAPA